MLAWILHQVASSYRWRLFRSVYLEAFISRTLVSSHNTTAFCFHWKWHILAAILAAKNKLRQNFSPTFQPTKNELIWKYEKEEASSVPFAPNLFILFTNISTSIFSLSSIIHEKKSKNLFLFWRIKEKSDRLKKMKIALKPNTH